MNNTEILLGDNPFFGIDHLSQERARERMKIITGFDKITEIMEYVYPMGVKGFVVSTHPELKLLVEHMSLPLHTQKKEKLSEKKYPNIRQFNLSWLIWPLK